MPNVRWTFGQTTGRRETTSLCASSDGECDSYRVIHKRLYAVTSFRAQTVYCPSDSMDG
jgi:hypothetical protein